MRAISKLSAILLFLFLLLTNSCIAQETFPFLGEVNTDAINIRSDSRVSAEVISQANKGDKLEVVLELYGWYKVRLPKIAPSFIKKSLAASADQKIAKVTGNRVNVRLSPNESSPILGKIDKDQTINILEDKGDWYKIEPINDSFGWINKRFITKIVTPENKPPATPEKTKKLFDIKSKKGKN